MLGRIRTDLSAPVSEPRGAPGHELAEGCRSLARPFFRVLWSGRADQPAVNALFFAAVLRLIEGGFAPLHIGLVEAAAGVCGILGALAAPALIERSATGWLTVVIAWSFLPLVVPMVLWNNPVVVAAALGLGMFLNPAGNAGIGSYRIAVTPPELRGRVQSTSQFVSMSTMPLAPVLAGGCWAARRWRRDRRARRARGVALIPTLAARPLGAEAGGLAYDDHQ